MESLQYNNFNIKNIKLERDTHTYILNEDSTLEFTSVTTFIAQFFEKFEALKTAKKLVNNIPKYSHITVEELLDQWKDARDHGTKVHNEIENYLLKGDKSLEKKSLNGIDWLKLIPICCPDKC